MNFTDEQLVSLLNIENFKTLICALNVIGYGDPVSFDKEGKIELAKDVLNTLSEISLNN